MKRWIIGLLLLAAAAAGCSRRTPREPHDGLPHIKVMTYNVNYGLSGDEDTMAAIEKGGADIVFLQETTREWEEALLKRFKKTYPHMEFRHCCGAGGLAVLSKYALEKKDYISSPSGWFPAWRLLVDSPLGKLQLLNIHLHPPVSDSGSIVSGYVSTPKVRLEEIESFYACLEPELPTLIAGDFNEKKGGRAVTFLSKKGFQSVLPEFHPGKTTWRWKTSLGTVKYQLDHIMYNKHLRPLSAEVISYGRSDHLPVVAVFESGH